MQGETGPVVLCHVVNPDAPRLPCVLTQGHYPPWDGKQAEKLYWHQDVEGNLFPNPDPEVEMGGTLLHPEPPTEPNTDRQAYWLGATALSSLIDQLKSMPPNSWVKRDAARGEAIIAKLEKMVASVKLAAEGGK